MISKKKRRRRTILFRFRSLDGMEHRRRCTNRNNGRRRRRNGAFQGQYSVASSLRTTGPPPSAFLPASLPIPPTTVFSFGCSEKYIDTWNGERKRLPCFFLISSNECDWDGYSARVVGGHWWYWAHFHLTTGVISLSLAMAEAKLNKSPSSSCKEVFVEKKIMQRGESTNRALLQRTIDRRVLEFGWAHWSTDAACM